LEGALVSKKRTAALVILGVMVSWLIIPRMARPQAAGEEEEISPAGLIEELRDADSYNRGRLFQRLGERGEEAVPALTEVVDTWRREGDEGLVAGCMLMLGQIGESARGATDPLIEALDAPSARIRYASARALGGLWAGAGNAGDQIKRLNAALLSTTYTAAYEGRGAEAYAPILSLIRINEIPIDQGNRPTLTSVPLSQLRAQVGRWMTNNSQVLPPFEEQPWQLLMAAVLRRPGSQRGQQAKQTLVQQKPLGAIASIVRTMRRGRIRPGSSRWTHLADVLTGITGVSIPRDPDKEAVEVVAQWNDRWLEELRGRTAEKYRSYSLQRLERSIARAKEDPRSEVLEGVERMKTVLLYQLSSDEQLPENISPEARELLEHPLELKGQLTESVKFFRENEQAHRRLQALKTMQRVVERKEGQRVGRQFLDDVVQFARQEERRPVLVGLARLLRNITGVPIVLGELSREERNRRIDEWLKQIRQQGEKPEEEED
jgi:hypothetical protein